MCFIVKTCQNFFYILWRNFRYLEEFFICVVGFVYCVLIYCDDCSIISIIIGVLYIISSLMYILHQGRWIIFRYYFLKQSITLILLIYLILLIITESIIAYESESLNLSLLNVILYDICVLNLVSMETSKKVTKIVYLFYPLIIFIITIFNIVYSFTGNFDDYVVINGEIHTFTLQEVSRLLKFQIGLYCIISFYRSLKDTRRLYFTFLVREVQRDEWIHFDTEYERKRKFRYILCFFLRIF